ncbi:MAG: hypothetical protein QX197_14460 [Methylococcaceae bacterium]
MSKPTHLQQFKQFDERYHCNPLSHYPDYDLLNEIRRRVGLVPKIGGFKND